MRSARRHPPAFCTITVLSHHSTCGVEEETLERDDLSRPWQLKGYRSLYRPYPVCLERAAGQGQQVSDSSTEARNV